MPSSLTRTTARIYGTLSGLGGNASDVLSRLLPFFDPILRVKQGHQFDVEGFAREVRDTYKWNFNSDVVEVFLPRLVEAGWLTADDPNTEPTTYHITLPDAEESEPEERSANQELRSLAEDFKEFSEKLSPLTAIPREVEEFEDILIEWLLYVEAFSEKNIEFSTRIEKSPSGTMRQVVDVPRTTDLTSEERFLCARFVQEAIHSKPETAERLARIASIGLLTEVVQDFVKPTAPVEASNLLVYLDAPVAMEYLGVSGKAARENTVPVVDELKRIGVQVRVFGQSIEEIKRNLGAVLRNPRPTGPTAQALARNEVIRDFVVQVNADPEAILSDMGITVTHRTLDQTPSEHQYFQQAHWSEIYGALVFQQNNDARAHDADVTTLVMRQRHGHSDRDIFRSRSVLATRNGLVAQLTRKKCIELGLVSPSATPPIVHRRYLTASMWLRTGLGEQDMEIPKRLLLANCERVLAIRPGVVEAVKNLTDDLGDPEKARQLDLLVSQHRSAQALMDKTLGTASVVTPDNLAELFQEMIHPHLEEERKLAMEAVQTEKKKGKKALKKAQEKLDEARSEKERFQSLIDSKVAEDRDAVAALFNDVEAKLLEKRRSRRIFGIMLALLLCVPMLLEPSSLITWVSIVIAILLGYLTITGNQLIGTSSPASSALKMLNNEAGRRHINTKLAQFEVDWDGSHFSFVDQDNSERKPPDKLF
nr:hypothetical protein [uncultured Celeribacter sp.]